VTRIEITDRRCKNPVRVGYWLAKWPLDGGRFKQCKSSIQSPANAAPLDARCKPEPPR
jgi:hypothetical protein